MQLQSCLAGRTGVDQLDGIYAVGLAVVLEEDQPCHRKYALSFGQRGFLNALFPAALHFDGNVDHRWRGTGIVLTTASSSKARLGFRCNRNRRLPLWIFE